LLVEALEGISKMTETPDSIKSKINCGTYTLTQNIKEEVLCGTFYIIFLKKTKVPWKGGYFAAPVEKF